MPRIFDAGLWFLTIGCLATLFGPMGLAGQRLEIAPRVGFGLEASTLRSTLPALEAAVRLEILKSNWGAYGRLGILNFNSGCEDSLPARCGLPNAGIAHDLGVGLSRLFSVSGRWTGYASVGVGVLSWDGNDYFLDAEGGLRRALGETLSLVLGLHAVYSAVERPPNGLNDIVSPKNFVALIPVVGLSFGVGSR